MRCPLELTLQLSVSKMPPAAEQPRIHRPKETVFLSPFFGGKELSRGSSPVVEQSEGQAADERSTLFTAFLPFHRGARLERELFLRHF